MLRPLCWHIIVMLTLAPVVQSQELDGAAIYQRFQEAITRGDLEVAKNLLSEQASWTRAPSCLAKCIGIPRIEQEIRRQIADQNDTRSFTAERFGDEFIVRFEHRSDATRKRGVERRIQLDRVVVRDGKIINIVSGLDLSDPQTARFAGTQ